MTEPDNDVPTASDSTEDSAETSEGAAPVNFTKQVDEAEPSEAGDSTPAPEYTPQMVLAATISTGVLAFLSFVMFWYKHVPWFFIPMVFFAGVSGYCFHQWRSAQVDAEEQESLPTEQADTPQDQ